MSLHGLNKKLATLAKQTNEFQLLREEITTAFQHEYQSYSNFRESMLITDEWKNTSICINLQRNLTELKNKIKINQSKSKHYKKLYKLVQRQHRSLKTIK